MEFKTQRELLEYLNKDPNDRKLVSRMVQRGEIIKRWWLYVLLDKDDKIKELEHKLKDYDNLVEKFNKVTEDNNRLVEEKNRLIKEKNDLINQLNQLEMEESWKNDWEIINKVYKYLTQVLHLHVDKTDFVEWIEK